MNLILSVLVFYSLIFILCIAWCAWSETKKELKSRFLTIDMACMSSETGLHCLEEGKHIIYIWKKLHLTLKLQGQEHTWVMMLAKKSASVQSQVFGN